MTVRGSAARLGSASMPAKRRFKEFGRGLTYRIAGLPIALRHGLRRGATSFDARLRRAYARRYWSPRNWSERTELAVALAAWPLVLIGLQVAFTMKNGKGVARRFGRPVHRQLIDQLRLYLRSGVLPPWYYIFELHRQPTVTQARSYFYRWETKTGILELLKEKVQQPLSELNDKAKFADRCAEHQVRTPAVLAIFRAGRIELRAELADLETDLFVKPIAGRGGKGAQRWDFVGPDLYGNTHGEQLSRDGLFRHLAEASHQTPLLVQQRLKNHPALEPLNNGALSTVRVLTCLNEQNEPEIIGAGGGLAFGSNNNLFKNN
jgi:hypothetical protein